MSLSSRWQHLCTISIMLGCASKYAAERLISRLGLGTTTSSFRFGGRAVQAAAEDRPTSSSSIVQAAADLGSCHQPARQEDPALRQEDIQHLLLSPHQPHHGLLGSRYRRSGESHHLQFPSTTFGFSWRSLIWNGWRVELFLTTSPPKWIFFYWRIQYCFLEQKQLFNHFSALFQINFFHHCRLVTTVFWRTIIIPR